ncbi:LytTR family DNA-binding domain-containing protein [Phaeodactylibacter sp.]|jgi:DNA-binding LytR/AlgR family response regulator|uniref:LytR/AlgR family response regulator transcription factor n=1 Tax=Phaeodactylibacter sp. TaxID=1940289 RepID=UPI0025FAED76|nr:LytTR family DNA-binding domain-containing protein [Phaeodactylibacter sp.]MCI4647258.1 LytTR family DNA-binding domain-containing protein [Phaeodactylibacter sp.]MCI5089612.1 LytTR family DNA-binding domain-containing protein [Phaeodactylibacter sp.]
MNVLIVEDESHTAALLKEIIEQDTDFIVTEMLESVEEAVQYLSRYQPNLDLLFFDIQLADGQSFEIFKHIDVVTPVVFCTAFEEYPLQAIKSNGIDYVLKPFKDDEIHSALLRYKQLIAKLKPRPASPINFKTPADTPFQRSFLTQYREKTIVKRVEEIALFSVEHENVFLYVFKGGKFPLFKKLDYIESVCDPAQFFRINRQLLINRDAIISFEPYFNRKIILQLKPEIKTKPVVSRLKVTAFKEWLEQ